MIGVELSPTLVAFGSANLARAERPWARIESAEPDRLGWPAEAPYDRILVSAQPDSLPTALVEQLDPSGRMVIPVRGALLLVAPDGSGGHRVSEHGSYRFVPLR